MDIELASNFKLFAAARPTLSPSYFLCFFSREGIVNTDDVRYCIAQTTGDTLGPIVLNLEETDSGVYTDAQVELYAGDWQLTVYEQTSDTNYNPADAGRAVWSELVRVNEPSTPLPARVPYVCQGGGGGGTVDIYFTDGVTLFRQVTAGNTLTLFPVEILQTNNDGDDVAVGYLDLVSDDGFNFGASPVLQASTVTDTLGLTEVVKLIAAQTWPLPASSIAYFDQTGAVAYWADVNTGFVDSKIRPATTLPRFTIFESDGVTVAAYRDLLDNTYTLAACDPLTWTLVNTNDDPLDSGSVTDPCGATLPLVAPDGMARTTLNDKDVVAVPSGGTATLPKSVIDYIDASGNPQETTGYDTDIIGAAVRPDVDIPRRELKNLGGTGFGVYVALDQLIGDTVPNAPIPCKFVWNPGFADVSWTITADEAGTYNTYTPTGTNGTITFSNNGSGFAALSGAITLVAGQVLIVRRTTTTSIGWTTWVL